MNITVNDTTPVKKELVIEVSQEELKPHFDKAYQKFQKTAKVPGFRPGKVPISHIEKMYGASIQYNEIQKIANDFYAKAIDEKNLKPIARPSMKTLDYQPAQPLKFTVNYDVKPEIKLGSYTKNSYKKINETITEEDVEFELDYILRQNSQIKEVTDRGVGKEDILFLALTDSQGKEMKDKVFRFDSPEFSDADKELLVGKKGDEKIELNLLEENKPAKPVTATIKMIYTFDKPELTDNFVKTYTQNKFETIADFKEDLKHLIEKTKKDAGERSLEESVITTLTQQITFELPETLVEAFLESMIEEVAHQGKNHELPADFDEYDYKLKNRPTAEKSTKWLLIKEAIIEKENLSVSDEDFNQYLETIADKEKLPIATLKSYYQKPQMRSQIENVLLTKKVISHIVKDSKIEEISMLEWQKQVTEKKN